MQKKWTISSALFAGAILSGLALHTPQAVHADTTTTADTSTSTAATTTTTQADTATATSAASIAPAASSTASDATQSAANTTTASTASQAETATAASAASTTGKSAAAGDVYTRSDNSAAVSYLPAGQIDMTTGKTDSIAASAASQAVGSNASATVVAGSDDNDQPNGFNTVEITNRSAASDADTTAKSVEIDDGLDANTLLAGDVKHYGEYTDDGWLINTLTMTDGIKPAATTSFELDVTPIVNGDTSELVYTVADGVKVHISAGSISSNEAGLLVHYKIPGAYLSVTIFGTSVFNDITQTRVTEVDGNGQSGRGYVNVPFTFHYYDADGKLCTGILNFVNTKKATTTDSSAAADSSAASAASSAASAASSAATNSTANSAAGNTTTTHNATTSRTAAQGETAANVATTATQLAAAQHATAQGATASVNTLTNAATNQAAITASALAAKSAQSSLPATGDTVGAELLIAGTLVTSLVGLLGVTAKKRRHSSEV